MPRVEYCLAQAALCRELAQQMSSRNDADRLCGMAAAYEAEASGIQSQAAYVEPATAQEQQQQQQQSQPSGHNKQSKSDE